LDGSAVVVEPILFLLETANAHVHTTTLTTTQAIQLMDGTVASVVKTSSTQLSHTHTVTITFNTLTEMFEASVASGGSPAHTHTTVSQNNVAIVPIYHNTANAHIHVSFLTQQELNGLMSGTLASVVKNSSTNSGHFHVTTITWDSARSQLNAVSASGGSPAHVHATAAASCSPFGASFHTASSEAESTTASTAFQTKLTLTTSSLPLGDYIVFFTCGASNSGGKNVSVEFRRATTRLRLFQFETSYAAPAGEYTGIEAHHYISQLSGVVTFDIRHRTVNGNTARIGDAHIALWRVQ
jgi:hypothetical protein